MLLVFLINGFFLFSSVACQRTHNQTCSWTSTCADDLICKKQTCKCPVGYAWSSSERKCKLFSAFSCKSNAECQDVDNYRTCVGGRCRCVDGHPANVYGVCLRGQEDPCVGSVECTSPLLCESRSKKCRCPPGKMWWTKNNTCAFFARTSCKRDSECQETDPNRICSPITDKCVCRLEYQMNPLSQMCLRRYNKRCGSDKECDGMDGDLVCNGPAKNKTCVCRPGFELSPDVNKCVCSPTANRCGDCKKPDKFQKPVCKVIHNGTCYNNNQCKTVYKLDDMFCSSRCRCGLGLQWSTFYEECRPFDTVTCISDSQCQDYDRNRVCDKHTSSCRCRGNMREDGAYICNSKS